MWHPRSQLILAPAIAAMAWGCDLGWSRCYWGWQHHSVFGNFNDIFPGNYGSISTGTAGLLGFRDGVTPIRNFGRTAAPVGSGSVVTWDEGLGCKIWRVVTRKTSTNFSVLVAVKAAKVLPFLPEMFGVSNGQCQGEQKNKSVVAGAWLRRYV